MLSSWQPGPLLRPLSVIWHAVTSPLRGGRRIDFPKGDHRRPPAFFSFCDFGQGLRDTSISAISSVFGGFWSPDLIFLTFPETAAGPGASEKPCAHLGRLLGALGRAFSPLDRLLGSLEALLKPPGALLEASWDLSGRAWRLPGASWGLPGSLLGTPWVQVGFRGRNRERLLHFGGHPLGGHFLYFSVF